MWVNGWEIAFIDCFIIDIGISSKPTAFPDWKLEAMSRISDSVANLRKIEFGKFPDKKVWWELGEVEIF